MNGKQTISLFGREYDVKGLLCHKEKDYCCPDKFEHNGFLVCGIRIRGFFGSGVFVLTCAEKKGENSEK